MNPPRIKQSIMEQCDLLAKRYSEVLQYTNRAYISSLEPWKHNCWSQKDYKVILWTNESMWAGGLALFKQSLPLGADFSLSRGRGSSLRDLVRPQTEADCRLKPQAHSDFSKDLLSETNFRNIKDFFLMGQNRQPLITSFDMLPNGQLTDFAMNLNLQRQLQKFWIAVLQYDY